MADDSEFAHMPPSQKRAYGPSGQDQDMENWNAFMQEQARQRSLQRGKPSGPFADEDE